MVDLVDDKEFIDVCSIFVGNVDYFVLFEEI